MACVSQCYYSPTPLMSKTSPLSRIPHTKCSVYVTMNNLVIVIVIKTTTSKARIHTLLYEFLCGTRLAHGST